MEPLQARPSRFQRQLLVLEATLAYLETGAFCGAEIGAVYKTIKDRRQLAQPCVDREGAVALHGKYKNSRPKTNNSIVYLSVEHY